MSNNVYISIIIPIYNSEKYLNKSINSILNQTKKEIELILVDDGSTDRSLQICDSFSMKDKRVKVIHKENGGPCCARNTGISVARGTHIMFLDSDDYLDLEACEKISSVIEIENPDYIEFGWKYINEDGERLYNSNKIEKNHLFSMEELEDIILPPLLNLKRDKDYFIYDFSVNKVYKREIIQKNKVYFLETRRTWEDRVFILQYLKYCKTFYSMNECFYNYVSVPNSLSRRYDMNFFRIILENYEIYKDLYGEKYNFETPYVWNYWCCSIENMILRSLKEKKNKKQIINTVKNVLMNKQVVYWYENRDIKNIFEKKISELIKKQETGKVIIMYYKRAKKEEFKEKINILKYRIYTKILKRK